MPVRARSFSSMPVLLPDATEARNLTERVVRVLLRAARQSAADASNLQDRSLCLCPHFIQQPAGASHPHPHPAWSESAEPVQVSARYRASSAAATRRVFSFGGARPADPGARDASPLADNSAAQLDLVQKHGIMDAQAWLLSELKYVLRCRSRLTRLP
jgi:hypothetical protein